MKVVILCGGLGTRIRDVADNIPKPMIPIGDLPILWHIMKYYAHFGHREFVLCLGYQGKVVKDFFLNYGAHTRDFTINLGGNHAIEYHSDHLESNWKVTLAETGLDSMTGSRIKRVEKYLLDQDNFMLTYGDGVGDIDLDRLLKFHLSHGKLLTLSGVRPPGRFGEVMNDPNGLVTEFNQSPQATGGRISGGFFVCRRELLKAIKAGDDGIVFEKEPMHQWVRDKQVMIYEHDGFWQPMDTYRDYVFLKSLYEKNEAPWVKW
jgi:glucose-1-phosphate cytidylyltransferase